MKLVSVEEMRAIEKEADARGLTYAQMMENAGQGLAEVVQELSIDESEREIFGLVGSGNNGGDTLVALAHLAADGWRARAYLIRRQDDNLVQRLEKAGGQVIHADDDREFTGLVTFAEAASVVLDGVLGTGMQLPLQGEIRLVLSKAKEILAHATEMPYVIAVDCPSGLDCDSGEAAPECISADLTVTMAAVKQGLLRMPGYELVGDLQVVDIGLPPDLASLLSVRMEVAERDLVASILPVRRLDAHKGTFGTALIVAGSVNYTGAAYLAGKAAYRVGAGLVTLAVPAPLHPALAGQFPEATWLLLPNEVGVISRNAGGVLAAGVERATAVLIGPGLGTEDTTKEFVADLLSAASGGKAAAARIGFLQSDRGNQKDSDSHWPPVVFDADGLRLISKIKDWHRLLPPLSVLTPHPGEMAVLTGLDKDEIQRSRQSVAGKYSKEWGHVVVLKGAFTIVAAPDGRTAIIPVASAALARAGTGDVLAGLIVGLRAQGVAAYEAAVAGAWLHAQAGLYAASALGTTTSVLAGDLLESIPDVLRDLERKG